MNKQELINNVKAWGAWCTDHNTGEKDRYVKINKVRELVEQLDEQPKITVPQFLDKYIQENKGECASDVFSEEWLHDSADELDDEVDKWLYDNDGTENDRRYLIAVQAFVTGEYEVEKEPLYYVIINKEYLVLMFTNRKDHRFIDKDELVEWHPSGYQLTEAEIKSIDKRYWAFAVPAEEVK